MAISAISRRKNVKFSYYRIKRLITHLKKLEHADG